MNVVCLCIVVRCRVPFVVIHCVTPKPYTVKKKSTAVMKAGVLVAVLFVCVSSLPVEQRKDQPGKQDAFPGLDKEEFKRYWDNAVKDNPGK